MADDAIPWRTIQALMRAKPSVLQQFIADLPDEQRAGYYGATDGGAATVNPTMMAQGYRNANARADLLTLAGLIKQPLPGISDSGTQLLRNLLTNSPTATWGSALPNVRIPNAYRGRLQEQGDLPETMTRDPLQWLRGT